MDELPRDLSVIKEGQHVLETLQGLKGLLQEAREAIGDPDSFGEVLYKLARFTNEDLSQLSQAQIRSEERDQLVGFQAQIAELERVVQLRVSFFAEFSLYLKTIADQKGSTP